MGLDGFDADLFDAAEFGDLDWVMWVVKHRIGVDGKPIDIGAQDLRGETIPGFSNRMSAFLSRNQKPP